ncbi:MAG: helix-turn-helix transcriptional regulator [Pseudomonadota bacterium]
MTEDTGLTEPHYLTTREVADLLRVKERKVYDLAAAGEIPHRRITGKLLFPRGEVLAWLGEAPATASGPRPHVLTGSHDPLLDWAVRESGSGLATLFNGSQDGLTCFSRGEAALSGLHVPDSGGWNIGTVSAAGVTDAVLIGWATRSRGLILSPRLDGQIASIADLKGHRVVLRQPGAGAAALFEQLLADAGMTAEDLQSATAYARTESDAAAAVASDEADAAPGIEAMARQFQLPFLPLVEERFDLLIDRRAYFTEPVQALLAFMQSPAFEAKATALGGYGLSGAGEVRWLSP